MQTIRIFIAGSDAVSRKIEFSRIVVGRYFLYSTVLPIEGARELP
jgi:hypothetical protein